MASNAFLLLSLALLIGTNLAPIVTSTAVSTGKVTTISTLVHSAVQVKTGIRISVMPGQRIFRIVVARLIADSVVPTPAICRPQM